MKLSVALRTYGLVIIATVAACLAQAATATKSAGPLRIGPDDTVTIAAFHCEEISKSWRVGASGDIELPMVGRVKAAGLTVQEFEGELRERLSKYIRNPNVSVVVSDFKSGPVTILGAVDQPGVRQLQGNRRLFDTLMLAGSLKPNAAAVLLTRRKEHGDIPWPTAKPMQDGTISVAKFPIADVKDGQGAAANIMIEPDDVLTVEAALPKLVHIIGEVAHPGAVELVTKPSIPLTKALAAVGGTTRGAHQSKVLLRRVTDGAETEVSQIDIRKIMKGDSKDIELDEGYVVIVPTNDVKNFVQAATMTAINAGIFSGMQVMIRY